MSYTDLTSGKWVNGTGGSIVPLSRASDCGCASHRTVYDSRTPDNSCLSAGRK